MRAFLRRLWSHVWFTDAYFGRINDEVSDCKVCGRTHAYGDLRTHFKGTPWEFKE